MYIWTWTINAFIFKLLYGFVRIGGFFLNILKQKILL